MRGAASPLHRADVKGIVALARDKTQDRNSLFLPMLLPEQILSQPMLPSSTPHYKINSYSRKLHLRQRPFLFKLPHSPSNKPSFTASLTSPVISLTPSLPITRER